MYVKKPIALVLGLVLSASTVVASAADDKDVFKPKHGSQVGTSTPTIYFAYESAADGYLVDLVGNNTAANSCDGAVAYQGYVQRKGSDCLETGANNTGTIIDGDAGAAFPPSGTTRVCQWTPPVTLNNGWYALSVTAYDQTEANLFDDGAVTRDALPRGTNGAYTDGCNDSYQDFQVDISAVVPEPVVAKTPFGGISCDANDSAGADGQCTPVIKGSVNDSVDPGATYFQIWINDSTGFNLTQLWYEKGNGASRVNCTTTGGKLTCAFPDQTAALAGGAGPYTWWARAWNPAGASAWSTGVTMTD